MRKKLKYCQSLRIRDYQHRRNYVEGDKVWFQPLNGNAWIGPALVVTQRGQSVYLHAHGELKKVPACRVKPYDLIDTETQDSQHNENVEQMNANKVMLEDRLKDVENMYTEQLNDFYYAK